jgi:hypothetical protein
VVAREACRHALVMEVKSYLKDLIQALWHAAKRFLLFPPRPLPKKRLDPGCKGLWTEENTAATEENTRETVKKAIEIVEQLKTSNAISEKQVAQWESLIVGGVAGIGAGMGGGIRSGWLITNTLGQASAMLRGRWAIRSPLL